MKKITFNCCAPDGEEAYINDLAKGLSVLPQTARILYARGIDTVEKGRRFLSPGREHLRDPFLMSGMREAVDRIERARAEGETVAIYGDYDADGISATSILYYALREYGIEAHCYIPERQDGYGLSEQAVEDIVGEIFPDLFITVDCGVSGAAEVELLKDAGVDVIVTDHHELPEVLPDCTLINPKLADDYPFDGLCGAGVAFKIACALIGEKAYEYFDFAAIATIADSMPLTDENRDIVYEGVKRFNGGNVHPAFRFLLDSAGKKNVNAMGLAFTLAPRINAAGRMGDARGALRLFLSSNEREIFEGCVALNNYNTLRQQECDVLYRSVKEAIRREGAYDRAIVLASPDWAGGFVGIVAARLADEYYRPVILFVEKDGVLKGSARSIDEVNVFDAVSACREYTLEFGGHAQAAGISVKKEDLPAFRAALVAYLSEKYDDETFVPKLSAEWETDEAMSFRFARELEKLEPCGVGNRKPLFAVRAGSLDARPMKEGSPHLNLRSSAGEMIYFGAERLLPQLNDPAPKTVVYEYNLSVWNKKEYLKAIIKDFEFDPAPDCDRLRFARGVLRSLKVQPVGRAEELTEEEMRLKIADCLSRPYGTLFAVEDESAFERFPELLSLPRDLYFPRDNRLLNPVILAPAPFDARDYAEVVYPVAPACALLAARDGRYYAPRERECFPWLRSLSLDRGVFAEAFVCFKQVAAQGTAAEDSVALAAHCSLPAEQSIFAAEVFAELGFISFEGGRLRVNRGVKAELGASLIYSRVRELVGN